MRYLVDSDWLIDAMSGRSIAVNTLDQLSASGLAVSMITVAEIYEGALAPMLLKKLSQRFVIFSVLSHGFP